MNIYASRNALASLENAELAFRRYPTDQNQQRLERARQAALSVWREFIKSIPGEEK